MPVLLAWRGIPCVVNPLLAGPTRRKTDVLDARLLAHHSITGLWKPSFIPTAAAQELRVIWAERADALRHAGKHHRSVPRCGTSGTLTGSQLYNKINCTLMAYGGARVDVPPVKPSFQALAVTALVAANAGGTISLKLTSPSDPGENTILIASPPVSQGIEVAPALYVIGSCPAPVLGASDITALYTAKFGAPAVGQKVYVGAFQHSDGYETLPTTYSAIIPAST